MGKNVNDQKYLEINLSNYCHESGIYKNCDLEIPFL